MSPELSLPLALLKAVAMSRMAKVTASEVAADEIARHRGVGAPRLGCGRCRPMDFSKKLPWFARGRKE